MQDQDKQAAFNAALARAIEKAKAVEKDSRNTYSDYAYASAEAIIEEARGPLAAEGFAVIPKRWAVRHLVGGPVSTGGRAGDEGMSGLRQISQELSTRTTEPFLFFNLSPSLQ